MNPMDLRVVSVDELVTATKLEGSSMQLLGWTTPEGWPFIVLVAVAKSEDSTALVNELHEKMTASRAPVIRRDLWKEWP